MARFLVWSSLSAMLLLVGCSSSSSEEERVCDDTDPQCSCQALSDGWCVQYHSDAGSLAEGECADLGGEEVKATCPTEGEVARCREIDDCHSPAYIFYDDYAGGFEDYADLDELEAACNAGQLVGSTCADWLVP